MAWVDYRKASDMVPHSWIIGTLSKDDDDGSENVVKKVTLHSFKLNRLYLDPLNILNAGDCSWSWILKEFIQVLKEEGKVRRRLSIPHETSN